MVHEVEQVQGLFRHVWRQVGQDDIADILRNNAEAIDDCEANHRAIELFLALRLLPPTAVGLICATDPSGDELAADSEEYWQAEVASKIPPQPGNVGKSGPKSILTREGPVKVS